MSFKELNAFLANGFPTGIRVSATAHCVFITLCHRYDTRYGKDKSYPGMSQLMRATGRTRTTVQDAIKELLEAKLISQVQKGYRGYRAEYRPIYAIALLNNSVDIADTLISKESAQHTDSVALTDLKSLPSTPIVSAQPYAINTINTSKYDKERFDFIISGKTKQVQDLIEPGKNIEHLLDLLEGKRMSREQIKEAITRIDFTNAHSVGGLFNSVLKHLAGLTSATKSPYAKRSPSVDKYEQKQPPAFNPELDSFANNFGLPPG